MYTYIRIRKKCIYVSGGQSVKLKCFSLVYQSDSVIVILQCMSDGIEKTYFKGRS